MITIWTDDNSNEITLPTPSGYTWTLSDIDKESGRNDNGLMVRNRIAVKRKLTITWNADKNPSANAEMIETLATLPPFFYCRYVDGNNVERTMECYRGDIKRTMYRYDPANGNVWKESSVNFIER